MTQFKAPKRLHSATTKHRKVLYDDQARYKK